MTIEIKREFIPVDVRPTWTLEPFSATIWRYPTPLTVPLRCPEGFVPGLLSGYIDGRTATLAELDAALATIGLSRAALVATDFA